MEHNAHSIPLKHTGDPACGPCCWVRFTSQGFPWGPHRQISFSVCHPLWETRHSEEFGCLQPMSPQRRGCPGTPCNVACISRACLLTSSSAEGGEKWAKFRVKIAGVSCLRGVIRAGACRHSWWVPLQKRQERMATTGSSPRGPGCKSLGRIWSLAQGAGEVLVYNRLRTAVIRCS